MSITRRAGSSSRVTRNGCVPFDADRPGQHSLEASGPDELDHRRRVGREAGRAGVGRGRRLLRQIGVESRLHPHEERAAPATATSSPEPSASTGGSTYRDVVARNPVPELEHDPVVPGCRAARTAVSSAVSPSSAFQTAGSVDESAETSGLLRRRGRRGRRCRGCDLRLVVAIAAAAEQQCSDDDEKDTNQHLPGE